MESILYLECNSGISGDMVVAALLDLGADRKVLADALESLPLDGYTTEIKSVYKSGIRACDFHVILDPEYENHDHDMAYLHGSGHFHGVPKRNNPGNDNHGETEKNTRIPDSAAHDTTISRSDLHDAAIPCGATHMHDATAPSGAAHNTAVPSSIAHNTVVPSSIAHNTVVPSSIAHDTAVSCGAAHGTAEALLSGHGEAAANSHHQSHSHSHTARNLNDIIEIINAGSLTEHAKALAVRIFKILAKAEASVHGKSIEEVHFHEVGAVDSIVDITAAAVCLDNLHPDRIVLSPLTDGRGQIRCQHGLIPIPVPAVSAIVSQEGIPMRLSEIEGELVTPTGAAIAAAIRAMSDYSEALPETFFIRKIGLGAGKRNYESTGLLRAMMLEPALSECKFSPAKVASNQTKSVFIPVKPEPRQTESVSSPTEAAPGKMQSVSSATEAVPGQIQSVSSPTEAVPGQMQSMSSPTEAVPDQAEESDSILVLETNVDDCSGEALAFTMKELLAAGALDAFYIPVYMKKGRPAHLLAVICNPEDRENLEDIIFRNTTTIGIRWQKMQRTKLQRQVITMQTPWGRANIKRCVQSNEVRYYPENDDVCRLALQQKAGFPDMYRLLQAYAVQHADQ